MVVYGSLRWKVGRCLEKLLELAEECFDGQNQVREMMLWVRWGHGYGAQVKQG